MFTGIIEATGTVTSLRQAAGADWRITITSQQLDFGDVNIGDSIAVSGCCLTVVALEPNSFSADVSNESLACTNLGKLKSGSRVNLEKALLATARLGGHMVSGHVDGVGKLLESVADGNSVRMRFEVPAALARYVAGKGSICIDGTSLTVNETKSATFTVNVIPHTQHETIIGDYALGQQVNLEVDVIARYLERLLLKDTSRD
ncbi:MAG: riboflavin synthase [Gammaproteobacteria bacterium]|nr:riboflavin synthase [Gammaproteobacteria bacterium]